MAQTPLEELVHEQTTATLTGAFQIAIGKIGEEIAKEVLSDPTFRHTLRTLVQEQSKAILAQLTTPSRRRRRTT